MKIKKLLKSKDTDDEVKHNKNTLQLILTEKKNYKFLMKPERKKNN